MTPDKELCLGNIYALAKEKKIRIGDLETTCGVSIGYLARLRQDKKQNLPGSEFLFRAAMLLETSVDSLLSFDYRLATETEKYLRSFISQLTRDTIKDELAWRLDASFIPSPYITDSVDLPSNPKRTLDPELMQQGKGKEIYLSSFRPALNNLTPRVAWRAAISENTDVILIRVTEEQKVSDGDESQGDLELYLYYKDTNTFSALCHTDARSPGILDDDLEGLCEVIEMSFRATPLEKCALNAIDSYMKSRSDKA